MKGIILYALFITLIKMFASSLNMRFIVLGHSSKCSNNEYIIAINILDRINRVLLIDVKNVTSEHVT